MRLRTHLGLTDTAREKTQMPAGDPQRTWFREMIDRLRDEWYDGMPFPALIELCESLDAMLQQIRSERKIRTPTMRCRKCGAVARQSAPHVSVRATILSLSRFGIASREVTKRIERDWAKYRKLHQLDIYGQRESELSQCSNHVHT
jgi:hypothetical protein